MLETQVSSLTNPERLAALRSTGLLGTPGEESFDRLTRVAARLLGVPIAHISLVGADHQFIKSAVGIAPEVAREVPLSHSLCSHVVAAGEALVVDDASRHALAREHPGVREWGVGAYAAVPLHAPSGHVLGSFCAVDMRPRVWSEADLRTLADLAATASSEIELRSKVHALAEREAQMRDLLEHAHDMVLVAGTRGVIVYANATACEALGYTRAELEGMEVRALVSPDDWRLYLPTVRRVQAGEGVRDLEGTIRARDGRPIHVQATSSPLVEDGRVISTRIFMRDVTAGRAAARLRNELVSLVSHEIRTPLTAIQGAVQLLRSRPPGVEAREGALLEMAHRNTRRLVRIVNDLLDIERLDSGGAVLHREAYPAHSLLADAAEGIHVLGDEAGIHVRLRPAAPRLCVWADPQRVMQVLTNLLANAIKFSPRGSTVELSANAAPGSAVEFHVRDHGRGIPADKLELIFGRFEQVDADDARQRGGSGLGLAICRAIVAQHGGRIWAESTPGAGSTFRFTLPAHLG